MISKGLAEDMKLHQANRERAYTLMDEVHPPVGHVLRCALGYEYGLPEYLQHDLDAYKEGLKNGSSLLDCTRRREFEHAETDPPLL